MDVMRSFPNSFGNEYIFINIPSYSLNLFKNNVSVLNMDVAVGSSRHQSCVLNSNIDYLVINPAWYVPSGIAESEIFPLLQNGSGINYLKSHNIQSLKVIKKKTLAINPDKVNWKDMTLQEFKAYRFTQKPGEGNLLGKVKFIFHNPCEIYLHDSIESDVFDASMRDLSHGCIRMGEPLKLTNYVLTNEGYATNDIQDLLQGKTSHTINLKSQINIDIVYLTSLVNHYNFVQFRDDIYGLLDQYMDLFPVAQPKELHNATPKSNLSEKTNTPQ
jgi:murein L,D-transpeptidase YcbB/YkuD